MKKVIQIIAVTLLLISLFIGARFEQNESCIDNKMICSNVTMEKMLVPQQSLGWEVGDTDEHTSGLIGTITATCQAISDKADVVILVQSSLTGSFPENEMLTFANKFQTRVYDPVAEYLGVPRASTIDGSHGIAVLIADLTSIDPQVYSIYSQGGYSNNGYESITIDNGIFPAWEYCPSSYQFCIQRNYRTGDSFESWFGHGMAEAMAAILDLRTTNRSTLLPYYEGTDTRTRDDGTNIPLLYYDSQALYNVQLGNHGGAFAFVFYIYEKFGANVLGEVLKNSNKTVIEAFDEAFITYEYDVNFDQVFKDFALAMRLDDPALNNGLWSFYGLEVNPTFGLWGDNTPRVNSASDFPIIMEEDVFHRGIDAKNINFGSSSDISALQIEFNGSTEGNFTVWSVTSVYFNSSYSENIVTELAIDQDTQTGTNIMLIPSDATSFQLITANLQGTEGKTITNSWPADLSDIRNNYTATITSVEPGLTASFTSDFVTEEDIRLISIEADIAWELDQDITTSGIKPMVTLYDQDGEFAFNVQAELTYDSANGNWVGIMEIPDDIKAGTYVLKLAVQGIELSSGNVTVGGTSAPSFIMPTVLLATTVILMFKRKNQHT